MKNVNPMHRGTKKKILLPTTIRFPDHCSNIAECNCAKANTGRSFDPQGNLTDQKYLKRSLRRRKGSVDAFPMHLN